MIESNNQSSIKAAAMDGHAQTSEKGQTNWLEKLSELQEWEDADVRNSIRKLIGEDNSLLEDFDFVEASIKVLSKEHYILMTEYTNDEEMEKIRALVKHLRAVKDAMVKAVSARTKSLLEIKYEMEVDNER